MEKWKENLLNIKKENETVSILDETVTGVKGNLETPNTLFYSEFSKDDAETLFYIFTAFKNSGSVTNPQAIRTLDENLSEQINAMPKEINPIEVLLYTSKCIKDQIYSNATLFKMLKGMVARRLHQPDTSKILWYILSGWEWLAPVSILIEAIGDYNKKEYIDMAMKYYTRFAKIAYETNDKYVLNSYLNMLFATQNTDYISYIADVVASPYFVPDNVLVDNFLNKLKKKDYLTSSPEYRELLNMITNKSGIPAAFRYKISLIIKQLDANNSSRDGSGNENSEWFDINNLEFGRGSSRVIRACKQIRDKEDSIKICKAVMEKIDDIYPEEQRGDAYILLGTKGKDCRDEIVPFLYDEMATNSLYKMPIMIALQHLKEISAKELCGAIAIEPYREFWGKLLGSYCRFQITFLAEDMIPFFTDYFIDNIDNENLIATNLTKINKVLEAFNGKDGRITKDNALPGKLISLLSIFNGNYTDSNIYENILDLIDLLGKYCSIQINNILKILDMLKANLKGNSIALQFEPRINGLIKKYDAIIQPGK